MTEVRCRKTDAMCHLKHVDQMYNLTSRKGGREGGRLDRRYPDTDGVVLSDLQCGAGTTSAPHDLADVL